MPATSLKTLLVPLQNSRGPVPFSSFFYTGHFIFSSGPRSSLLSSAPSSTCGSDLAYQTTAATFVSCCNQNGEICFKSGGWGALLWALLWSTRCVGGTPEICGVSWVSTSGFEEFCKESWLQYLGTVKQPCKQNWFDQLLWKKDVIWSCERLHNTSGFSDPSVFFSIKTSPKTRQTVLPPHLSDLKAGHDMCFSILKLMIYHWIVIWCCKKIL